MKPLKLEDIKYWPKKLHITQYTTNDKDHITMALVLVGDRYFSNLISFEIDRVLSWINRKEIDRKLFYKAIFEEEMSDIISESSEEE